MSLFYYLLYNYMPYLSDIAPTFVDKFLQFWEKFGELGLFIYSTIETITPLAGAEIFFVTLISSGKPWWRIALVATLANVFGALIVYFILAKNDKIYNKLVKKDLRERSKKLFDKYGFWAIFIFAMTPLPFFLVLFTASIAKMNIKSYVVATVISRGSRFFITTYIFDKFTNFNTWQVVLILVLITIPMGLIMFLISKFVLPYFEKKAEIELP
ncbi:MAG TPA: VTT domain-containing protein [Acholeplasma sp.]|nr:VTT domain-containing protein [Acholeplasma sp.]